MKLPEGGTAFISVKDSDKAAAVTMARRLAEMGFALVATRGTASRIREAGLEVQIINKVLEGRPHCVDAIKSGDIQLVINTDGRRAVGRGQLRHPPQRPDARDSALHHGGGCAGRGPCHCGVEGRNP